MGVLTISEKDNKLDAEKVGRWRKRHTFALITIIFLICNVPQFIRVQAYFLQNFQAMAPDKRIRNFSWKMLVWKYRYDLLLGLTPDGHFSQARATYIKEFFVEFYPVGGQITPFKAALEDITKKESLRSRTCSDRKRKNNNSNNLKYESIFGCRVYLKTYIPIFELWWSIVTIYDNKTGRILSYYGSYGSSLL